MARIADYSIITDNWVFEADKDTISFEIPSTINKGSRSILGFMLEVHSVGDVKLSLRLNGIKVWNWNYSDGRRVQFYQEVISANVLKPGKNVFSFKSTSGEARFVQVSDVVLWWQANV